ncbi:MAG: NmrA family NAD(P)-binding protein [Pseudomonadota bacterium]
MKRVLVIGATGDQGHPLLERLVAEGLTPVAAVRSQKAFSSTRFADVEKALCDITDAASLVEATKSVDAIVAHLPFVFDKALARSFGANIAQAAAANNLERVVFNTSCHVHTADIGSEGHDGRRAIEEEIMGAGVPYTIFEPKVFMDNITRSWCKPGIALQNTFAYPAGPTLKINWTSLGDVAAYMVAALLKPEVASGCYPIGGPESLTGFEVAERLSNVAGCTITFESLTPDQFASAMSLLVTGKAEVEPLSIYDRMAEMYRWYNAQDTSPLMLDAQAPAALFGVTLTSLEEWAKTQDWNDPTDPALATRMAGAGQ